MSFRILDFFDYESEKSIIHHVDPRGKALFVIVLTCITILFRDLVPLFIIFGLIIPLIILARFFKKWMRTMLVLLPLILLIIILNAVLLKVDYPTTVGIAMALRLIILTAVYGLFFQTVSPDDIAQMLVKFRLPFTFAWAISTAYRFIPTLANETDIIMAAQKSRGLQIDRGNIFKRARNMVPLLIPIFASAMRRSWQLAEAIESRGWNATKKRTYLYSLKMKWWDYLIVLLSLALFGLFLFLVITQIELPNWMQWVIPSRFELKGLFIAAWEWIKGLFTK